MEYIPLRLPIGVAAGPSVYSTVNESIFDLTNDIPRDQTWDNTKNFSLLRDQLQKPLYSDDSTPFLKAQQLEVYVPLWTTFCDGYIDDFFSVGLDKGYLVEKSQEARTLAVHSIFRPLHPDETISRDDPISIKKL